jgi:hypothetical protein
MKHTWRKDSLNHLKEVLSETLTLKGFELVRDCKQKVHANFKLTDEKYYQTYDHKELGVMEVEIIHYLDGNYWRCGVSLNKRGWFYSSSEVSDPKTFAKDISPNI